MNVTNLLWFESDVISDGTQTRVFVRYVVGRFESDVISDGTQTLYKQKRTNRKFESDVISDGTQTQIYSAKRLLFRH